MTKLEAPTVAEIQAARQQIDPYIVETPVWQWKAQDIVDIIGRDTEVHLKLELFQQTGTFKARGALVNILRLGQDALARGVTAVSAGNHAIAVAFAAKLVGTTAKVVMFKSANPVRIQKCRDYGAEIILAEDAASGFEEVQRIEKEEGRYFVHPFEGVPTILGTATLGYEWCNQIKGMDAVIIPIGGGGLCAGIASAVKQMQPRCQVFGVEPEGADTMYRSLKLGAPQSLDAVRTIADSLGAPYTAPYSMSLCQRFVDEVVLIDDDAMRAGMSLLFRSMKLAVEPAGAAATAAICGPLRERLQGKKVGVIVCGANIDIDSFAQHVKAGQ